MYTPELVEEERRIQRSSAIMTIILMIMALVGSFVWWVTRDRVPPPGEEYEVIGAIDFGDMKVGSKKVNSFERAVEKPSETPPQPAKPKPTPVVEETDPAPEPTITQEAESPITQPKSTPTPKKEVTPTKPKPTPTPQKPQPVEETETETTKPAPPVEKPKRKPLTDDLGGSNQGDGDDVGNQGAPNIKVLDPNGLYSFGAGVGGGASNRAPLSLPPPAYTAQEEGRLTFKFILKPDGTVGSVTTVGVVGPNQQSIKRAGINAIKRWRFSRLKSNQPQVNQQLTVTITFKLRG